MAKGDALLLLLGKKAADRSATGGPEADAEMGGTSKELVIAARDLLDAVKADDPDAVATAFKSMAEICDSYDSNDDGK